MLREDGSSAKFDESCTLTSLIKVLNCCNNIVVEICHTITILNLKSSIELPMDTWACTGNRTNNLLRAKLDKFRFVWYILMVGEDDCRKTMAEWQLY